MMTYDDAITYCKLNRERLMGECAADFRPAQDVVKMHRMHVASPGDPGAQAFLIAAVEDHKKIAEAARPRV